MALVAGDSWLDKGANLLVFGPPGGGKWNSVFKRCRRWVKADAFYRMSGALAEDADFDYAMIDGTLVRVHRHGQGAKGGLKAKPSGAPVAA